MVKFENRVALSKVNRFLKPAPLVIFFYCRDRNLFQKQFSKSLISNHKADNEQPFPTLNDFKIKSVKNKFLIKALLEKVNLSSPLVTQNPQFSLVSLCTNKTNKIEFLSQNKIESNLYNRTLSTFQEKGEPSAYSKMDALPSNATPLLNGEDHLSCEAYDNRRFQEQSTNAASTAKISDYPSSDEIFDYQSSDGKSKADDARDTKGSHSVDIRFVHGNPLLLSLENIAFLGYIKDFVAAGEKNENLYILGGFYENSVIDSEQTKRLIFNSENNRAYIDLRNKLNQSFTTLLSMLKYHTRIVTLLTQLRLQKKS